MSIFKVSPGKWSIPNTQVVESEQFDDADVGHTGSKCYMKYYFIQFKHKGTYSDVHFFNATQSPLLCCPFLKRCLLSLITEEGFSVFLGIKDNS